MDLTIANTIRQQLYAGGTNKVWSWGSHAWKGGENFLMFRVTGRLFRGVVKVTLNSMDTYDIELMKLKGEVVKRIEGIYCDELTSVIDEAIEFVPEYKR